MGKRLRNIAVQNFHPMDALRLLSDRFAEPLGAASVRWRDVDLCICQDARQFAFATDLFRNMGIDIAASG
jgi:hypothetical protein